MDEEAIRCFLKHDRQCRRPAGGDARPRSNLYDEIIFPAQDLRPQSAAIEFGQQSMSHLKRGEIAVQDASLHVFDYNRKAISFVSI